MDPFQSNLQVPGESPGPSRSPHHNRPVSVQPTSSSTSPSSARKRASHSVVTGQQEPEPQPSYRDVYSHPAALEYAAAHPRRTIPKFGPYLLLQTLGEGEFGKVKLGLHMQWGEEVAVKLIRRGNIDTTVRMSKVEREIEVLRMLKHPNIVRLYDVIETDKYIGIILEYASGGELFDHILAHRYLREKDACKLFSQLLSGVWYIHQKKIVHRDLKLENLLLDRNRNVIITDFGFANRFEHRADDLMQTSCGSPCYAAPELVISDGLYVGSAVDIWSCGVILYAMLAGYLPFDDDPANPDGDNINLLYRYIVNTPLSFPEYISAEARDLLSIMLVPDPAHRADLPKIMAHRWLAPYAHLFSKSVDDLERTAMEQHQQKRLAYQRQMRQNADPSSRVSRSHSSRTDTYSCGVSPVSSRSHRHPQPEYLYETSPEHSHSTRRGVASAIVMPSAPPVPFDDDPFAPSSSRDAAVPMVPSPNEVTEVPRSGKSEKSPSGVKPTIEPVKTSPDSKRQKGGFRHTIQVEVPEADSQSQPQPSSSQGIQPSQNGTSPRSPATRPKEQNGGEVIQDRKTSSSSAKPLPSTPLSAHKHSRESDEASKTTELSPPAAEQAQPVVSIEVTSPPVTPAPTDEKSVDQTPGSSGSGSSRKSTRHRKGYSIDKINITKLFTNGSANASTESQTNGKPSRAPSQRSASGKSTDIVTTTNPPKDGTIGRRPTTLQVPPSSAGAAIAVSNTTVETPAKSSTLAPPESAQSKKSSRRNTLTVVVEPFKKPFTRSSKTAETPVREHARPIEKEKEKEKEPIPDKELIPPTTPTFTKARPEISRGSTVPASTYKASSVMNWFRSKSTRKPIVDELLEKPLPEPQSDRLTAHTAAASSSSSVNNAPTPVVSPVADKSKSPMFSGHPTRSASSSAHAEASFSLADRMLRKHPKGVIARHTGPVDPTTITTQPPAEVMTHIKVILEGMGIEFSVESEYKYRCVRVKRKRAAGVLGSREGGPSLTAFNLIGSAASNGVDKRGLPAPPQSAFSGGGGMLRGLLMRRQSSQVSGPAVAPENDPETVLAAAVPADEEKTIYGDTQQDQGDEVRFSVELTRLDRLEGTYSLDIRRLKGNLRSYKFLYDTLRDRANLQR